MRALYWFRNDLRLHDNEALTWLCQNAQEALFVYSYPLNFSRAGKFRRKFLLETLISLQRQLEERGHSLFITYSHPEEVLPNLIHKYKIDTLVFTEEYSPEELKEEKQVLSHLVIDNIVAFDQRTLTKKARLPFELLAMPESFTEFRTAVEQSLHPKEALSVPVLWPKAISIDEFEMDLGRELRMFTTPSRFTGGETQALMRLRDFIWDKDLLKNYKDTRHGLLN
ncbi:MAG: deoxyribodipyrimidine photo-lyase, partial [Bdellovibrio sp.]|nr:deoxyribodipyrimidine photo-lyase [Bdellovibrio sp.]